MSNPLKKLTNLLTKLRRRGPAPRTDLDQVLGKKIKERQAMGKPVDTHIGGPNMPGYQDCPRCRRRSKRVEKTAGGANYQCREHGKFFVRAPGL